MEQKYFNLSEAEFTKTLFANSLVWAPDGDEAFDDGSYVLQFDVGDRVRLIAFKRPDSEVDPASLREIWLSSDVCSTTFSASGRARSSTSGNCSRNIIDDNSDSAHLTSETLAGFTPTK